MRVQEWKLRLRYWVGIHQPCREPLNVCSHPMMLSLPCTANRQTCLWMSVGCSLGCKECDGGTINGKSVGTNPNGMDRCSSGLKPWTNNDPMTRTFNRNCTGSCIGSEHDFTKFNPCD